MTLSDQIEVFKRFPCILLSRKGIRESKKEAISFLNLCIRHSIQGCRELLLSSQDSCGSIRSSGKQTLRRD